MDCCRQRRAPVSLGALLFSGLLLVSILVTGAAYGIAIEVQRTTLGSTLTDPNVQTINFVSDVFVEAGVTPLVFVIATNRGGNPCELRVHNVGQTSFDLACFESPGEDGPHLDMDLHYIAVEPGVHSIPATVGGSSTTVTLAAGSTSTSAVQHGCASVAACGTEGSTSVSFGTTFSSAPAALLEIQTLNSESGSPPTGPSQPWLSATIVENAGGAPIISTTGMDLALERSQVQQGTVVAETMAWLAVEATSGCTTLDFSSFGGPSSVPYEAVITGAVVDGWSDGCNAGEGASFTSGCFSSAPAVVADRRTRNEDDGGWLRRCTAGFSATAVRFTVDEDLNSGVGNQGDTERNHVDEAASVLAFGVDFSTPVTLAHFVATAKGDGVTFQWSTATEVGNIGFFLSEWTGSGWSRIPGSTVKSTRGDSTAPQFYSLQISKVRGSRFRLSDLDRLGRTKDHGPFELGQTYGARSESQLVDWQGVRVELEQKRERQRLDGLFDELGQAEAPNLEILLSTTGIFRITYEEILAAGLDLNGVPTERLSISHRGSPVPIHIETPAQSDSLGPGAFLEFYGEAVEDSLYTRTNRYQLGIDGNATPLPEDQRPVPRQNGPETHLETLWISENHQYSFGSPNGDPWFHSSLLSFGSPHQENFALSIEDLRPSGDTPRLQVELWGVTDFPRAPDHHVQLDFNGQRVWDGRFDGLQALKIDTPLPSGLLREGENILTISIPGDTGTPFDLVHLEGYGVSYSRALKARGDLLDLEVRGAVVEVEGFTSPDLVAYRLGRGGRPPTRLPVQAVPNGDSWTARFRGRANGTRRYLVSTIGLLGSPNELRPQTARTVPEREATYLVITHPAFEEDLAPLVSAREARGMTTLVVDVETLYARYNHGVVDPEAIRRFIAEAVTTRGTQMVLLVGGDTYDYFDFTGSGSVSFIPTPYVRTDPLVAFTPADPLLADVDGDGLPDVPIGRLPVRTSAELTRVISKILAFEAGETRRTAVFTADGRDGMTSFSRISDSLAEQLPNAWAVDRVSLDDQSVAEARSDLLAALNSGVGLASFFGHSGPTVWTFDALLNASDANALVNEAPTVVTQWGCWNTYHVEPTYDTLGHRFLLGEHGAVAVLGAATLTHTESERRLGIPILQRATQSGVTLGEAIQGAKNELSRRHADLLDVLLGWTLLGDPALVLDPVGP